MIEINPGIFLAQIITFLAAVFILWKLAWGPLINMLKERQEKIKKDIDSAESARQAVERLQQEYNLKLAEIQQKTDELLSQAKQDGERLRKDILNTAQKEAEELRNKVEQQLKQDKNSIAKELRNELTGLSVAMAEKLLQGSVDKKLQDKLFKEVVDKL
ncbi:MAG: F0F1 ATP synthase subunit B [Elusimicrobia bacterium]|nr:F0F1 ATP synthase subunit B [Elusimicrobiota bacterium]MBU2614973.1 F0F1 ATP synthase subunit B [Elusimicrobiota bacterium]